MPTKLDLNDFKRMLNEKSWEEAMEYKDSFVPKELYKYFPLFDENYINFKEDNKKRLKTFSNNKIWVSSYENFNDPFEFKMLILDQERLSGSTQKINNVERILEEFKKRTMIACFSCEVDNNMPLWAHYANNHLGYCVKYTISNPKVIFPVLYEPVRVKTAAIPSMIVSEMLQAYSQNLKEPTENFYKYFFYFYLSLTCKHLHWQYENEYRLLYETPDSAKGFEVPLSEVGLAVESIYIGYKCNELYKEELISIGRRLDCKIFEMHFDEHSETFELKTKRIV